ncbi:MAG: hypothetical protein ACI4QE_05070 [Acutalibacteraceae bacterium]
MLLIILSVLVCVLAIIGFTDIISQIYLQYLTVKNDGAVMLFAPSEKNQDSIEMNVRSILHKAKWMGSKNIKEIIIISNSLKSDNLEKCKKIAKDSDAVKIMTQEEFLQKLTINRTEKAR